MNRVLFSSQSVHWATPQGCYQELNNEFNFNYDPCPLGGNGTDGTKSDWHGKRVFCNPPYNRGITDFLRKALEADLAVFLLPARTDTKWFHEIVLPNAKEIRFIRGRLKFGGAINSAPFPSCLAIFYAK
jgi:DNA N-6-adenine-methyltransferase (Dam)